MATSRRLPRSAIEGVPNFRPYKVKWLAGCWATSQQRPWS
jgi:hypothetical protein